MFIFNRKKTISIAKLFQSCIADVIIEIRLTGMYLLK